MDKNTSIPMTDFAPERFLHENSDENPTDPYMYAFGFGRR